LKAAILRFGEEVGFGCPWFPAPLPRSLSDTSQTIDCVKVTTHEYVPKKEEKAILISKGHHGKAT
jgi:hypothetical protein